MQTEMESREQRRRHLFVPPPALVLLRVALRLYQGYSIGEVFETKDILFYALMGALWLYDVFGWLKERRAEKECLRGEKEGE